MVWPSPTRPPTPFPAVLAQRIGRPKWEEGEAAERKLGTNGPGTAAQNPEK